MTTPETATSKETPRSPEQGRQASFEERMMALPADAGKRRPTTWQASHRGNRFNAHGCGG